MTYAQLNGYHDGEDVVLGALIGNYKIVRRLGQGGMGEVFLGEHTLLGRRAALKILLPSLSSRPEVIRRFFNEARAVTSISDPGIVQVFDFGYHTDGRAFLVMEYLEGETLEHRLSRFGSLAVSETLRLARQLASSLAEAHAQHVIHRDLKPENIYLVRDSEVAGGERTKILDFGIAKLSAPSDLRAMTTTGVIIGTPPYMSPEQCRGLAEIDHRSDIYSLGCVLYRMITGELLFSGEGPGDVLAAHIGHRPPAPSSRAAGVPASVDELVLRCLNKAPADRFSSMTAVTNALAQVQRELQLDDAAPTLAHRRRAAPKRRRVGIRTPTTLRESSGQIDTAKDAPPSTRSRRWIAAFAMGAAIAGFALFAGSPRDSEQAASRPGATATVASERQVAPLVVQAGDAPALSASPPRPPVSNQAGSSSTPETLPPAASPHGTAVPIPDRAKKPPRPPGRTNKSPIPAPSPSSTRDDVVTRSHADDTTLGKPEASTPASPPLGAPDDPPTASPSPDASTKAPSASPGAAPPAAPLTAEPSPAESQEATKRLPTVKSPLATTPGAPLVAPQPISPGATLSAPGQQPSAGAGNTAPTTKPVPPARPPAPANVRPTAVECSRALFDQVIRPPTLESGVVTRKKLLQNDCLKNGRITEPERDDRHRQLQERLPPVKPR